MSEGPDRFWEDIDRALAELDCRVENVERGSLARDFELRDAQELLLSWVEALDALERRPDA